MTSLGGASETRLTQTGHARSVAVATASVATSTSAPTSTSASVFARLCLVHSQSAPAVLLIVQGVNRRVRIGVVSHFNESKSAAPTCLSVHNHLCTSNLAEGSEQFFKVGIADREGQIADI
jgi:hypothetical protein